MVKKDGDQMIIGYCDYGYMLVMDFDLKGVMVELIGCCGGLFKGKGGLMYMFFKEKYFYGGYGIVGVQVLFGIGFGFVNKYWGNGNVVMVFFGDGVFNQGQVYESFNMVELWKLLVVYVIENNKYGMGISVVCVFVIIDFFQCGVFFGILGEQVDGMDVCVVKVVFEKVFGWCWDGKGLYILEMIIYCYCGYFMFDLVKYCFKDEVQKMWIEYDLIEQVCVWFFEKEWVIEDDLKVFDKDVWVKVVEVVEFVQIDLELDMFEFYIDILF